MRPVVEAVYLPNEPHQPEIAHTERLRADGAFDVNMIVYALSEAAALETLTSTTAGQAKIIKCPDCHRVYGMKNKEAASIDGRLIRAGDRKRSVTCECGRPEPVRW